MSPMHGIATCFALAFALLAPAPATAGSFHVYGLGLNGAGCPNGWQAQTFTPAKLRQVNFCSRWEIQSNRDGTPLRYGDSAGASMFTADGARFTGFAIRSHGHARNGTDWSMAICAEAFRNCYGHFPQSGSWGELELRIGTVSGKHLWAGVACRETTCPDSAAAGRAVQIDQFASHATVEDYTPPGAPALAGVSTGWNSGEKRLAYSASDAGSGVESVTLTVDGSLHRTNTHSCTRLPGGGYQHPAPCVASTSGAFALNEPGQLADGRHTLSVTARDAGGESGSATQEFFVDNNTPAGPAGLAVTGGDGWRAANDFGLTWTTPGQGSGSRVAAAFYKIGSPPARPDDGTRVPGDGALTGLAVPGDGEHAVFVWLQDEAGNADHRSASEVKLRLDTAAPAIAFATGRDAQNPAEVRASAADAHSGLAGGVIAIRRRGTADWQALATGRDGDDLVATIPDERLERGTYELQASAWDAVGNTATTARRSDGREMLLELPLRGDTRLRAGLSPAARGALRPRRVIRLGYRRAAWLRGVLRSGAAPLPGTRLLVAARPLTGGAWRPLTEVITDAGGRYAVRLPTSSSRELRVHFPGTRSLRPATSVARLVVRGWASLRLAPRTLRRGATIAFRGRVGLFDATLPAAGKLVQIQYLDGRRWRPAVKLGHTDGRGRFAIRYRFRRISRPTRIWFRILVPAEGGWPYATGASRTRTAFVRP